MVGSFASLRACAANGLVAIAPQRSVISSRRFMLNLDFEANSSNPIAIPKGLGEVRSGSWTGRRLGSIGWLSVIGPTIEIQPERAFVRACSWGSVIARHLQTEFTVSAFVDTLEVELAAR
jgi:hypothetical protein